MDYFIDLFMHLDVHLASLLAMHGTWIYAILFLIIFCETGLVVTPFLPGDSLLFATGTLAAISANHINVHLIVLLLIAAAVLGDACNYIIGKFFGDKFFKNPKSKIFKQSYLNKTHSFYRKYGKKTIIISRFVPIVRTFAPFIAGVGRMEYIHFLSYNIIGGIVWVSTFVYAGYFFGELKFVKENLSILIVAIILISLLPIAFAAWKSKHKESESS